MSTLLLAGSVHGGDDDIYICKRRQRQLSGFRECSSPDLSDNAIPSLLSELNPAVLFPLAVFFLEARQASVKSIVQESMLELLQCYRSWINQCPAHRHGNKRPHSEVFSVFLIEQSEM